MILSRDSNKSQPACRTFKPPQLVEVGQEERVQPLHLAVAVRCQLDVGVQFVGGDGRAADGVLRGRAAACPAGLAELARVVLLRLVLVVRAHLGQDVHPLLLLHAVVGLGTRRQTRLWVRVQTLGGSRHSKHPWGRDTFVSMKVNRVNPITLRIPRKLVSRPTENDIW